MNSLHTRHTRAWQAACVATLAVLTIFISSFAAHPVAAAGGWTGATAISPAGNPDPQRGTPQENAVALNSSGVAVAVWDSYSYTGNGGATIGAAVQRGGKWGKSTAISNPAEFAVHPRVAVSGDGTTAAIWTATVGSSYAVEAAILPAGSSTWTAPTILDSGPTAGSPYDVGRAQIAMDGRGNATAVWPLWNGTTTVIEAATRPAGGSWSAPTLLSDSSMGADSPSLAVNARGDAVAASATGVFNTNTMIRVTSKPAGGSWSTPTTVSAVMSIYTGYEQSPRVAVDASGLAAVAWKFLGSGSQLMAAYQTANGAWTQYVGLTPTNSQLALTSYDLGMDGNGNMTAAATLFDSTINVDKATMWVVTGTRSAGWKLPATALTSSPQDPTTARVAVSPDGSVVLAGWIDFYYGRVQVSQLGPSGWGNPTMIGKATSIGEFSEYLSMAASAGGSARAVWKTDYGVTVMAASR